VSYVLTARQVIPRQIDAVYAFFAQPENLSRLTPPSMGFELRSDDTRVRDDLELQYRLRPLLGVPAGWTSRLESVRPPHEFTDVQVRGPYRSWTHVHRFVPRGAATEVTDEVTYALPFGPVGSVAHELVVRGELEALFRYRAWALASIFTVPATTTAPVSVAVAGGTGFVGGAVASELYRRGHRVVVLSHRGEAARGPLPDEIEIRTVDATRDAGLGEALADMDALVVALAFPNSPIEAPRRGRTFEAVDAAGTERLVAAARQVGVGRVVYLSGAGAAPDATRHWFRAKWRAEEAVRGSGMTWTIIRPTWIYGPRDASLNRFLRLGRQLLAVPMTSLGRQIVAPVFIEDAARLVADCLTDPAAANEVFDLGGPEDLPFREIIGTALEISGLRRPILPAPAPLLKAAAAPLALLPEPPLTPDAIDFVNQPATVDNGRLLARMPRRLTPLGQALATYLAPAAGPGEVTIHSAA
jgi:NADH dehydrogenase